MGHVRTTRTDPEAWVNVGTQTWHPAEIMVSTDTIWIALSPEDARHLISNLSASLKEVAP